MPTGGQGGGWGPRAGWGRLLPARDSWPRVRRGSARKGGASRCFPRSVWKGSWGALAGGGAGPYAARPPPGGTAVGPAASALPRRSCTVSTRPAGPLTPPTRRPGLRSRYGRASAGRPARKLRPRDRDQLREFQVRVGFDRGTLAMAHIGLTRAGGKPARFADKRTGHRPLSNPALRRTAAPRCPMQDRALDAKLTVKWLNCHWHIPNLENNHF